MAAATRGKAGLGGELGSAGSGRYMTNTDRNHPDQARAVFFKSRMRCWEEPGGGQNAGVQGPSSHAVQPAGHRVAGCCGPHLSITTKIGTSPPSTRSNHVDLCTRVSCATSSQSDRCDLRPLLYLYSESEASHHPSIFLLSWQSFCARLDTLVSSSSALALIAAAPLSLRPSTSE